MSLVEYITYLKFEIADLRSQLSAALAQIDLYEPLLKEREIPPPPLPEPPPPARSFWDWFRS
jgi:hypothetical protein